MGTSWWFTVALRVIPPSACAASIPGIGTIYNSTFMDLGLKNRVALVAASSQGLGLATAEAFAAEGCRVAMCARNPQTLQAAAEKIRKQYNVEVFAETFDVGDAAAVTRFVAAVADKFGSVDICVTNAGGPPAKGFLAATLEDWQRALDAELPEHGVLCTRSDPSHAAQALGTHHHHYLDHHQAAGD